MMTSEYKQQVTIQEDLLFPYFCQYFEKGTKAELMLPVFINIKTYALCQTSITVRI